MKPEITIRFCCKCRWWLRAGWMAQELFATFGDQLAVCLEPGEGGEYRVLLGQAMLWDRAVDGGFPEPKELKQRIRDAAFPEQDLGHAGRS